MILLLALLMTIGALSYPVIVDVRKHGRDNILNRTTQDLGRLTIVRDVLNEFRALRRWVRETLEQAFYLAVLVVLILLALLVLSYFLR